MAEEDKIPSDQPPRSSLTSLRPSIYEHVAEHGRTYHAYKAGKYMLPNDEREQDRLDLQHAISMGVFDGKLALAPIDTIPLHNVLDIATGTGIWAIEFADKHPSAKVIGTDLSPIQPTTVPVNCSFEIDDAEDQWLFSHKFDYIHARGVVTCFKDIRQVIGSAFEFLVPGGYLEFKDGIFPPSYAEPPPADSAFVKWITIILEEVEKAGRPWTKAKYYANYMRDVGFVDVIEHKTTLAAGPWPEDEKGKKLGRWHLTNWLQVVDALTPKILANAGWDEEEIKVLVALVRSELTGGKIKVYNEMIGVWGRKPPIMEDK